MTAWVLRGEVGRFDRFRSGKQLARYCGLTPWNASSGLRQADAGLIRACNHDLRSVLIEAGHRLKRCDPRWSALANQLRQAGKPGSVIAAAVANRWRRWLYHEMTVAACARGRRCEVVVPRKPATVSSSGSWAGGTRLEIRSGSRCILEAPQWAIRLGRRRSDRRRGRRRQRLRRGSKEGSGRRVRRSAGAQNTGRSACPPQAERASSDERPSGPFSTARRSRRPRRRPNGIRKKEDCACNLLDTERAFIEEPRP